MRRFDRSGSLLKIVPFHFPIRLWLIGALAALPVTLQATDFAAEDTRSFKQALGGRFLIGVGTGLKILAIPQDAALVNRHFQILTSDNCVKPRAVHPLENKWDFKAAEGFANLARNHRLEVAGHCPVWANDDRTSPWMMEENGAPVSRDASEINPDPDGISDEHQQQLAAKHVELFKVCVENSDIIESVSFWNLHDEESWLNVFPWKRVNHPHFFDRQRQPKPAFEAVYQYLSSLGK